MDIHSSPASLFGKKLKVMDGFKESNSDPSFIHPQSGLSISQFSQIGSSQPSTSSTFTEVSNNEVVTLRQEIKQLREKLRNEKRYTNSFLIEYMTLKVEAERLRDDLQMATVKDSSMVGHLQGKMQKLEAENFELKVRIEHDKDEKWNLLKRNENLESAFKEEQQKRLELFLKFEEMMKQKNL